MQRSAAAPVFAALMALAVGLAAIPALAAPDELEERLEDTRDELDGARGDLDAAASAVRDARDRLADLDDKLAVRSAELERLRGELEEAEAAHAESVRRLAAITARLREAGEELDALIEEETEHRERLSDRVATTYMRGGTTPATMLTVIVGVTDLHDVSLGVRAVNAVLDDDRRLVERTRELKYEAAGYRAELATLRGEHQDEEAAAQRARREVEGLVSREQEVVARLESERAERVALLQRIEDDRELQAAIVTQLEEQVSALATELASRPPANVMVDWEDLQIDGPMPAWAHLLPERGQRWSPAIVTASDQAGIDARLFAALVWSESSFQPGAVSHVGAIGLAQLMPGTAAMLGVDPYDPLQNLAGGSSYLARQLAAFGAVELALAAYNAGPNAVREHGGIPPYAETQLYVITVLERFEHLIHQG